MHDVLRVTFQRWRLLLLGAALFAILALVWAHYMPLAYTGEAIFERRRDAASEGTTARGSESFGTLKLTLSHELAGFDAVSRAVETLKLTEGMPRNDDGRLTEASEMAKQQLVQRLMETVDVRWKVSSEQVDLVSVSFTHSDPVLAEHMPNTLVQNYINHVSEVVIERLNASKKFLSDQVSACSNRFSELIMLRIDFERENAGVLPDSPTALQEGISKITTDIDTVRLQHMVAEHEMAMLNAYLHPDDPNATENLEVRKEPNPRLMQLEDELAAAQNSLDEVIKVRGMKKDHPTVQILGLQIARLEKRIAETPAMAVSEIVSGRSQDSAMARMRLMATESQYKSSARELERMENRLSAYEKVLTEFGPIRREYFEISKKVEDQQKELDRYESSLTEVQMALAAEAAKRRTHLNAVQAALPQFRPSSPSLSLVLLFALVGGCCFGGGLVFLANRMDRSVMTPEQAARDFDIPVYGCIDEIVHPGQRLASVTKRWILKPVVVLVVFVLLASATLSITLKLRYPTHYEEWSISPVQFLSQQMSGLVGSSDQESLPAP